MLELLVCISIIVVLAILLVTGGQTWVNRAHSAQCVAKLRQIQYANAGFAGENNGIYPRPPSSQNDAPHWYPLDYYRITLEPYLGERSKSMFCPGPLSKVRNSKTTSSDYATGYVTYQRFNIAGSFVGTLGGEKKPNLTRPSTVPPHIPLWGCLTIKTAADRAIAHGEPDISSPITGMNVAYSDGSVQWVKGGDLEAYISGSTKYYWPKPPMTQEGHN